MHTEGPNGQVGGNNLLKYVIINQNWPNRHGNTQAPIVDAQKTVEIVISALTKRRRSLGNLASMHLPPSSIREIGIRPDKVLDSKAGKAIEMLELKKVPFPPSLRAIEGGGETVYYFCSMNPQQAELLWQNGFRDIDELDQLGMSPLMRTRPDFGYRDFEEVLELPSWFLFKGANQYQLQGRAFRTVRPEIQLGIGGEFNLKLNTGGPAQLKDSSSNIAALHYLGQRLGKPGIYLEGSSSYSRRRTLVRDSIQWSHNFLKDSYSPNTRSVQLLRDILGDSLARFLPMRLLLLRLPPFTQMSKQPGHDMEFRSRSEALKAALVDTYCTALVLDVDTDRKWPGSAPKCSAFTPSKNSS